MKKTTANKSAKPATKATKKSATKTSKATKPTKVEKTPKSSKYTEGNWRVLKLTEQARDAFRAYRDENEITNTQTVDLLIAKQLPAIVEVLATLSIAKQTGARRPARLAFSNESLAALKVASKETGLAAAMLFRVCLGRLAKGGAE